MRSNTAALAQQQYMSRDIGSVGAVFTKRWLYLVLITSTKASMGVAFRGRCRGSR